MRQIEIDEDVWKKLKELTEPFVDTPNSVLRKLFKIGIKAIPYFINHNFKLETDP